MGDIAALAASRSRASDTQITFDDYASAIATAGYPLLNQTLVGEPEQVERTFVGFIQSTYKSNGVVFSCAMTRFLIFSQARIVYQQLRGGLPGDLFGTPELTGIEHPWPGATTADLLARLDLDVQFSGTGIVLRRPGPRYERLRPDWCGIVSGTRRADSNPWDPDAELLGLVYVPGGPESGEEPQHFTADEIALYAPIPDPMSRFLGVSWVRPALVEILGDKAASAHKQAFFTNGATPSMVITSNIADTKKWREWVELFRETHEGATRAYRTLHLQAGATATPVGTNLRQLDFKATNGNAETRIAAASGMHPVIVALSEGLQGSSLNSGNFRAAAKLVADTRFRPWWGNLAGGLERLLLPLPGTRLWYDDQHIPFLAEDVKDAAEALALKAQSIRTLTDGGFRADTVVDAVTSNDPRRLIHTGYLPVQVQPTQAVDQGGSNKETGAASRYMEIPGMAGGMAANVAGFLPKAVGERRATQDFTPLSGLLAPHGRVPRGTVLDATSPHALLFPSLFEPAAESLAQRARRLWGEGRTLASISQALDRSERHVQRLLTPGATAG
jgi:hypothetical protein